MFSGSKAEHASSRGPMHVMEEGGGGGGGKQASGLSS